MITGRPTIYSPELVDVILERLANGESMRSICRDDKMPAIATVCRWLTDNEKTDFREQYARACDMRADVLFEDILDIADTPKVGIKKTMKSTGEFDIVEADMIEHRKLQVDSRKWFLSKVAPKKYGDRLNQVLSGDKDNPVTLGGSFTLTFGTEDNDDGGDIPTADAAAPADAPMDKA